MLGIKHRVLDLDAVDAEARENQSASKLSRAIQQWSKFLVGRGHECVVLGPLWRIVLALLHQQARNPEAVGLGEPSSFLQAFIKHVVDGDVAFIVEPRAFCRTPNGPEWEAVGIAGVATLLAHRIAPVWACCDDSRMISSIWTRARTVSDRSGRALAMAQRGTDRMMAETMIQMPRRSRRALTSAAPATGATASLRASGDRQSPNACTTRGVACCSGLRAPSKRGHASGGSRLRGPQ